MKLEVDSALILLSPLPSFLSINAPFDGYLKLLKATRKGEKLKQGRDVTGIELGTPLVHRRPRTN